MSLKAVTEHLTAAREHLKATRRSLAAVRCSLAPGLFPSMFVSLAVQTNIAKRTCKYFQGTYNLFLYFFYIIILFCQASIHVLDCILKKSKRKHPKISVPLQARESGISTRLATKKLISGGEKESSINGCEIGDSIGACAMRDPISDSEKVNSSNGCETSLVGQTKSSEESAIKEPILGNQGCEIIGYNSFCQDSGEQGAGLVPADQDLMVKPGERVDNMFLQYTDTNKPLSSEQYDAPRSVPLNKLNICSTILP